MSETADVIVVGAGVQGASAAFHLAGRGLRVLVLERATVAAGATGRSSGFVRMHYDLETESRLAFASLPYFQHWTERVGAGECGFVRTGFIQLVGPELADNLRKNVAMHKRIGIASDVIGPDEVARLVPGIVVEDIVAAAYEPESGYADPTGTAAGFLAAARERGARLVQGCRVDKVMTDGDRVAGVETNRGTWAASVVVDAAGAWAAGLAATVGLDVPVTTWRHDTAYFGLPDGHPASLPIVIDDAREIYYRPEGRDMLLVGLEAGNEVGGSPDRPAREPRPETIEDMVSRVCGRIPWMAGGTYRTSHGGQDGITPDQRPIIEQVGPEGFYLLCGFSGTGFKTAPATGACLAELIVDGRASMADIAPYTLARFAENRPLVGEHPYGNIWR